MALALADRLAQEFATLYGAVKQSISKTTKIKTLLLENFRSTLESLEPRIKQIGDSNKLLRNPQLVERLIEQMCKGKELVGKFSKTSSKFNVWKYCFCSNINYDCYVDQILEVDRYLRRTLEFLWQHEEGKVMDEQFREVEKEASEVTKTLLDITQKKDELVEQEAIDFVEYLEKSLLANNVVELPPKKSKEPLDIKFWYLLDAVAVAEAKEKIMFKTLLGDIKFTVQSLKPFVEKKKVCDLGEKELRFFEAELDKGVQLVHDVVFRGLVGRSSNKKYVCMNQLLELNHSLHRQLSKMRMQTAREVTTHVSKNLVWLRHIGTVLRNLEKSTCRCGNQENKLARVLTRTLA